MSKAQVSGHPCRKVVIADDHPLLREGVKLILSQNPDFEAVAEASDGLQLLECLQEGCRPDALIVDITMPRMNGIEAIREIRKWDQDVRILMLTMHRDEELLWQSLIVGADGYILKENLAIELLPALNSILRSQVYISPLFSKELERAWVKTYLSIKAERPDFPLSTGEVELLRELRVNS